jgi:hypothetical protein
MGILFQGRHCSNHSNIVDYVGGLGTMAVDFGIIISIELKFKK